MNGEGYDQEEKLMKYTYKSEIYASLPLYVWHPRFKYLNDEFVLPDTGAGVTLGCSLLPWATKGLFSLDTK